MTYIIPCSKCGTNRELKHPPNPRQKAGVCRECYVATRKGEKREAIYPRVCDACGKTDMLKQKPTATTCAKCMSKKPMNELMKRDVKPTRQMMFYLCACCNDVRASNVRRRRLWCVTCARTERHKPKLDVVYNYETNQMDNNTIIPVAKVYANRNANRKSRSKKNANGYTNVGVDGLQKVNIRYQILDPDTLEEPKRKYKVKEIDMGTPEEDRFMIDNWLSNNEPTIGKSADDNAHHKMSGGIGDGYGGRNL